MGRLAARSPAPAGPAARSALRRPRDLIAFTAGAGYEETGVFKKIPAGLKTIQKLGGAMEWLGRDGPRGRTMAHVQVTFDQPASGSGNGFIQVFIQGERRGLRCPAPGPWP